MKILAQEDHSQRNVEPETLSATHQSFRWTLRCAKQIRKLSSNLKSKFLIVKQREFFFQQPWQIFQALKDGYP
jgi:hypothetical protein